MSGDDSGKTVRKRAVAKAEDGYRAAVALAKATSEAAIAEAATAETEATGRARVSVSRSATAKQLFDIENALRSCPGIKLVMTIGGGSDTVYYVKSQGASLLSAQFRALPCVADVVTADGGLNVWLKTDIRACSA